MDIGLWFVDLFKGAVIDNSSPQGYQKLQYLKINVIGDAAKLLPLISVTDHNFDIAMNTLINRYENKRIIIRTHPQSIVSYRSLTTDNARDLRNFTDATDERRLALQYLAESVNKEHIFLSTWSVRSCPQRQENNERYSQRARNLRHMQSSDFS